jgi:WD40-like Beta Propeller Repeat
MQSPGLQNSIRLLVVIGSIAASNIGCGSASSGRPPDAAPTPGEDASIDAPPVQPRCDPAKPFGTPTAVANINSSAVDQGAKLVDDLTLYFGSSRQPSPGLYKATRSSPTSPFGTPVALTAINATGTANGPTLTGDGLTMYYALIAPTQTTADLYVTARPNKAAEFPAGTPVAQVNSTVDDLDPFITEDGSALYFDSSRGSTALHLQVAVHQSDGSFSTPQALTNLNTTVVDGHPVLSHDGLTLYWSSTRADGGAQGVTDIWTATRPATSGTFGTPVRVPELSTSSAESVSWVSPDGCMVYLQSDRPGGMGGQDIYQAVKPM